MKKEYRIVWTTDETDLEKEVNRRIAEGWQPLGGVVLIRSFTDRIRYLQAMVKEEAENKG